MQNVRVDFKNDDNEILDLAKYGWMFAVAMLDPTIANIEASTYVKNREQRGQDIPLIPCLELFEKREKAGKPVEPIFRNHNVFQTTYTGAPYYCPDTSSFEVSANYYANDFRYV